MKEVFDFKDERDLDAYISKLIKDIYNSDSYQAIVPNNNLKTPKLSLLSSIFNSLASRTNENT